MHFDGFLKGLVPFGSLGHLHLSPPLKIPDLMSTNCKKIMDSDLVRCWPSIFNAFCIKKKTCRFIMIDMEHGQRVKKLSKMSQNSGKWEGYVGMSSIFLTAEHLALLIKHWSNNIHFIHIKGTDV